MYNRKRAVETLSGLSTPSDRVRGAGTAQFRQNRTIPSSNPAQHLKICLNIEVKQPLIGRRDYFLFKTNEQSSTFLK